MSNLRIIHKNLFDRYDTLTMAVGASASGFPLTNLVDDKKAKTWRSTDLLSPKIKVTWTTAQTLSGVALAFTNLISGSTFHITLYNDPVAGTLLHDSGTVAVSYDYDPPAGFNSIGSSAFAYGGGAHVSTFSASVPGVRRMEIEFTSAGNPDSYIEVSRIIAGLAWEPNDGADYGASISFIDGTTSLRTSSGDMITDRGAITRALSLPMSLMNDTDKASLNNLFRSVGKSQPIFVSFVPAEPITEEQLSQQIYGKIEQDISVELSFFQRYGSSIKIVEI